MLYNIVLVSAVEISKSALCIHVSPLFLDFLPIWVTTEHCIEFPVLHRRFSLVIYFIHILYIMGFPCGSAGKESACHVGDLGSIPGLGRSPGEGKGYAL